MITFKDSYGNEMPHSNQTISWRISGYAIIKNRDNRFLMVLSGSGLWHFPGGGIEIAENITEGVQRECAEETGYKVKLDTQAYYVNEQLFYHTREQSFYHSLQLFYMARLTDLKPDKRFVTGRDTERSCQWIDLETADENSIHETVRELVKKLRKAKAIS